MKKIFCLVWTEDKRQEFFLSWCPIRRIEIYSADTIVTMDESKEEKYFERPAKTVVT